MAFTPYKDVYTVADYEIRISDIKSDYETIRNGDFLDKGKELLHKQILAAKRTEQQILKKLLPTSTNPTVEELNRQMQEYRQAVVNFSGPELYEQVIMILEEENAEEQLAFRDAVFAVINNDSFFADVRDATTEVVRGKILEFLNQAKYTSKGQRFTSKRGMKNDIKPLSFTKEQRNQWKKIMVSDLKDIDKVNQYIDITEGKTSDTTATEFFNWSKTTNYWTAEDAKNYVKQHNTPDDKTAGSKTIADINKKIKEQIIKMVPTNSQDKELVGKIVDHILSKNFYEFFVGKNTSSIIGTFGEISALFYLSKFLGGDLNKALQWSGGKIDKYSDTKAKPHQDVILEDLFGIQVKNTKDEEITNVSFSDIKLDTALERISASTNIKSFIQTVYGTYAFNVKYKHTTKRDKTSDPFKEVDDFGKRPTVKQQLFAKKQVELADYKKKVDQLFSIFAATFMFLDVYDKSKFLDLNSLFLLGIDSFTTASKILEKITKDLETSTENTSSFSVSPIASEGKRINIVTALNQKSRSPDFSNLAVLPSLVFKSSFNFSL